VGNDKTKKRILVIDDDESFQQLLAPILKREGYQVYSAMNGEEALTMLDQIEPVPNLILLDVAMPIMDGAQFRRLQKARARIARIPVVVVTSTRTMEQDIRAIDAAAFLKKPIESQILLSTIESHLR
jgi:DNA-binding response OmpR family regulator